MGLLWHITPPDKQGLVRTPGIVTGKVEWWYNQGRPKEDSIIVLKFLGGMYWSARGEQNYSSTKFMVLRIKEIKDQPNSGYPLLYVCEEIVEFPVRRER